MSNDPSQPTIICSVVFLDIVGFSKEPVASQMRWKQALNNHMSLALSHLPPESRVILDTGDGAAICFLADPEDALISALTLFEAHHNGSKGAPDTYEVRMGINLGSVKVVKDINGQRNVVGDGINVGQRIMGFAKASQLLVSRSFYEIVSCLSQDYLNLFRFIGLHHDKHVREHAVYEVILDQGLAFSLLKEKTAAIGESAAKLNQPKDAIQPGDAPFCEVLLDPAKLAALENLCNRFFGPIAKTLIGRAIKSDPNLSQLCHVLSANIKNDKERVYFLDQSLAILRSSASINSAPNMSATALGTGTPAAPIAAFAAEKLNPVEKELARHVGPIAKVILKKECGKTGSWNDLIEALSKNIPQEGARAEFIKKFSEV